MTQTDIDILCRIYYMYKDRDEGHGGWPVIAGIIQDNISDEGEHFLLEYGVFDIIEDVEIDTGIVINVAIVKDWEAYGELVRILEL